MHQAMKKRTGTRAKRYVIKFILNRGWIRSRNSGLRLRVGGVGAGVGAGAERNNFGSATLLVTTYSADIGMTYGNSQLSACTLIDVCNVLREQDQGASIRCLSPRREGKQGFEFQDLFNFTWRIRITIFRSFL